MVHRGVGGHLDQEATTRYRWWFRTYDVDIRTAANLMGATTTDLRAELFDKEILDFSIDSRTVDEGEIFFALSQPDYERAINARMRDYYDERYGISPDLMAVSDAAIGRTEPFEIVPCLN